jgi:ribulose kinase
LVDILVGLNHGLSLADDKSAAFWTLKSLGSNQYGGWAADLLGDIGPPARKALPELEKNLKSRMSLSEIALAISKIDPEEAKRLGLPGLLIICPDKY